MSGASRRRPLLGGVRPRQDLIAGVTVAFLLVPQAMAYAMLAGLPASLGFVAATVPMVVYAFVGTSRELSLGPAALVSLMIVSALSGQFEPGSAEWIAAAALVTVGAGLAQVAMGLARLGSLTSLLSGPVLSGFTSAAAITISLTQLGPLLGLHLPHDPRVLVLVEQVWVHLPELNPATAGVGLGAILAIGLGRRCCPKVPATVVVIVAGVGLAFALDLAGQGVAMVGEIPRVFPTPRLPRVPLSEWRSLAPGALAIAFVSFVQSISVATVFAHRRHEDIDPDRELIAMGLANTASGLAGSFAIAGGFSRTAVAHRAGTQSRLSGLVTSAVVLLIMFAFAPLLRWLPKAVLGAIILVAILNLVDVRGTLRLWRVQRRDLMPLGVTFVVTLLAGVEWGIGLGVLASLLSFVMGLSRPHVAVLGRLPGSEIFRDLARNPDAITIPGTLVVRVDAPLFFGNRRVLDHEIMGEVARQGALRAVVLDASGVGCVDGSAELALRELHRRLSDEGIALYLAAARGPVRDVLERSRFLEELGPEHLGTQVMDVVRRIQGRSAPRVEEE